MARKRTPTTYYHVAGPNYTEGEDLLSWAQLYERGLVETYDWRWPWLECEAADKVSLFAALKEAITFAQVHGGQIVRVPNPEEVEEDDDGYPAVRDRIPARCVEILSGHEYEGEEREAPPEWEDYDILDELPEVDATEERPAISIEVIKDSAGEFLFRANDGSSCFDSAAYVTGYRATYAAFYYFDSGYEIEYFTGSGVSRRAACELGVPVLRRDNRYLVPRKQRVSD